MKILFAVLTCGLAFLSGCRHDHSFTVVFGLVGFEEKNGDVRHAFPWTTPDDFIQFASIKTKKPLCTVSKTSRLTVQIFTQGDSRQESRKAVQELVSEYLWFKVQQKNAEIAKIREQLVTRLPLIKRDFGEARAEQVLKQNMGPYTQEMPVIIADE